MGQYYERKANSSLCGGFQGVVQGTWYIVPASKQT